MKRKVKKGIGLFLCLILLAGCGKSAPELEGIESEPGEKNSTISLSETQLPFPDKIVETGQLLSASIKGNQPPIIYVYETMKTNGSKEESWISGYQGSENGWSSIENLPWQKVLSKDKMRFNGIPHRGMDGKDYLLRVKLLSDPSKIDPNKLAEGESQNIEYKLEFYRAEDGKAKAVGSESMFRQGKDIDEMVNDFLVLEDGTLMVSFYTGKMARYNLDTKETLTEYDGNASSIAVRDGNLYTINETMDKIQTIDVETGEILREVPFKLGDEKKRIRFCADENGDIYFVTVEGIFYLSQESSEPTCIFSSDKSALYILTDKENVFIDGICKQGNNIFVVYFCESDSFSSQLKDSIKFYQYTIAE